MARTALRFSLNSENVLSLPLMKIAIKGVLLLIQLYNIKPTKYYCFNLHMQISWHNRIKTHLMMHSCLFQFNIFCELKQTKIKQSC